MPDDDKDEQAADAFTPGESGFVPDTKEKADWVQGKIADARAHYARPEVA